VYQLPLPSDNPEIVKNGIEIMHDWAHGATLDETEINKERGVVLEEKRLGKGADDRMQAKYFPVILNNSRYAHRVPIGTEEVLNNFKPEAIKRFYHDWYRPDLQALIVVGDVDADQMEKTIKAKFADLKNPVKPRPRTRYSVPLTGKNQFIAVTDKEFPVTVAQILIKHKEQPLLTQSDLKNSVIRSLYNQMMGARFSELSKQANPPFLQAGNSISGFLAGLDAATTVIVAKPGEFEKGLKTTFAEVERVKCFGFTATELERAKASFLTSQESAFKEKDKTASDNFVQEYVQLFLKGTVSPGIEYEYNFYKKALPTISVADVNALAKKYITDTNRDVIIMAPEKDKDNLPTEAKVTEWISSVVADKTITPYVDQVSDKPLLATKPVAGKVVSEKKVAEIGVTELTLSNGVKVLLKPTDFKNDEIAFYGYSPGGTSLYSDADYQSAANAAAVISRGGVGEFNSIQLPKYLNGKRAFVSPMISERSEGISASTTPKDLETALQLTHLYFTAPRKDAEIFKGIISQQKGNLANRDSDPNSVFADTVSAVVGNYNVRRTGPSLEKLNQINLDRAYEIYKERFADASDFTFTFVGSFDIATIKPLLEQYLGSLPSINRKEKAVDLGIRVPAGALTKSVLKGQEPKATVRLLFSGDYTYNQANNNELDALAEVLNIKLIERLREDEGGVYGVNAGASYGKFPSNRYSFSISFGCAPENVDKLIASTLDEINKIKTNGAVSGDIQKFVAEETRTTETQLKTNQFWLGNLVNASQNEEDPKEILTHVESLKKVTPESLKAGANTYLSGKNLIKFILLPEKK
ncbi:MAG: insulinase family protein, partial [Chitinophagaceae bacterium]